MRAVVYLLFAACVLSSSHAAEVIRKPGSYASPGGTTSLKISDSPIPKAVFVHVHPDGKKTSVDVLLSPKDAWACLIQDEWTLWVYRKEDGFVRAVTILPPEEGGQFRASAKRVSIESEREAIPPELRAVINEKK